MKYRCVCHLYLSVPCWIICIDAPWNIGHKCILCFLDPYVSPHKRGLYRLMQRGFNLFSLCSSTFSSQILDTTKTKTKALCFFIEIKWVQNQIWHALPCAWHGIYVFVEMEDILALCTLFKVSYLNVVFVESYCADPNSLCAVEVYKHTLMIKNKQTKICNGM